MIPSRYRPMLDEASRRPALWRLLAGVITVFAVLIAWFFAIIWGLSLVLGAEFVDAGAGIFEAGPEAPLQAVLFLAIVAGLGVGSFVAAWVWQRRGPGSLIGPGPKTLRHFVLASAAAFTVLALLNLLTLPFSELPERNLSLTTWLLWLPVGIAAIACQTGAEEVFFRGYLQSQLLARFRPAAIGIGLPALLFGLAHYIPVLPPIAALTYVLIAAFFGILAADLTLRTGSLGAAWGFHFANNALAILFIAPGGSVTGLALWRTGDEFQPEALMSPLVTVEILILLAVWFAIRRVLRV